MLLTSSHRKNHTLNTSTDFKHTFSVKQHSNTTTGKYCWLAFTWVRNHKTLVTCLFRLFIYLFIYLLGSNLIGAVIIPAHSRISVSPTSTAPGTRMSVEGYLELLKMY